MLSNQLTVLHIAGVDMYLRLPSIVRLRDLGINMVAAGSCEADKFELAGIPFHHYPLARGANPIADRESRKRLTEIIRDVNPNVVHSFSTKPCVLVPPVARAVGVPAVLRTVCGLGSIYSSETLKIRLMRIPYLMLHRRASRAANFTVFQNADDHALFKSKSVVTEANSVLIPGSGIDIAALKAKLPDFTERERLRKELRLGKGPVMLMASRLVRQKGVVEFLQSAREIKQQHPETTFLLIGPVAGEGGDAVSLKTIQEYADCVNYLGYRSDMPALMSLSDVFVLPTRYREGVPRVLMEAAALGLACVTTNMPGCRDVIHDGQTGLMIEPGDQPALTSALQRLVASPELRSELGQSATARIQSRFEMEHIINAYIDAYGTALGTTIEPAKPVRRAA